MNHTTDKESDSISTFRKPFNLAILIPIERARSSASSTLQDFRAEEKTKDKIAKMISQHSPAVEIVPIPLTTPSQFNLQTSHEGGVQ